MKFNRSIVIRVVVLLSLMASLTVLSSRLQADTGDCGGATTTLPFTDVQGNVFFCQIASAYFSGLTSGTTATTFSPTQNVTREQMAAFTTRTLDQSLKRGNRRAALNQWWTTKPQYSIDLGTTFLGVGTTPNLIQSDGADLWVANETHLISRVRASDGRLLETWTGATNTFGVLVAMNRVFLTGFLRTLYMIDPRQPAGQVTTVSSSLGIGCQGIAFDGQQIWTANNAGNGTGSISIITPSNTLPWPVMNITTGFDAPAGILYDGSNIWVTDNSLGGQSALKKLDSTGTIIQIIPLEGGLNHMAFDGTNIWVPSTAGKVIIIRAASGTVIATLTGNGITAPLAAAFDGERVLITNPISDTVSLWKASDLTPLGSFDIGGNEPSGVCSDGLNFWITLRGEGKVARF
jgi:hypothetical protein